MAGSAVAGELSAVKSRLAEVEFAVATRADEAELRALLRATPTRGGAVSLGFEREPDYFAGEHVGGARDVTIVARSGGRVVCMGRCSRRTMYVNGVEKEAGYLGELRLAPGTKRGLAVLRAGYAFFAEQEEAGPAEFYFTSVANGNARARAVLESGRLGLPAYDALAELVTVAWPVWRDRGGMRAGRCDGRDGDGADGTGAGELIQFLDTQARRYALTTPWDAESGRVLARHGLEAGDFCVVRRDGRIVAAGGVWDQAAWRQTVVAGYAGATSWLRPVINGLARVAGRPGLPEVGGRLKQACVHPLAIAEDATGSDVEVLLKQLERRARACGVEWLVASAAADDALRARLKRRRGAQEYATRLYVVTLPGSAKTRVTLNGQRVRPEAGLL